jgi:hypothetical protein
VQALAEYRSGRFTNATDWAEKTLARERNPDWRTVVASATLAMALHKLENRQLAQAALAKGEEMANEHLPALNSPFTSALDGSWVDVIISRSLLREAKVLIEGASETKAEAK